MRLYSTDISSLLKTRKIIFTGFTLITIIALVVWGWITQPEPALYISLGWFVIVAILLWWGNRFLTLRLDRILPWSRWGNLRFFIHLLLGLSYLLVLMNLTYLVLKITLTTDPPTYEQLVVTNVYGAFIFIPVFSIYFSLHFLRHWRKSELAVERYQKENIRSQLESLKSHLDPHFLFNNLNILSALIDKDPHRSKLFMDKFADVYRFLLRTKSDDLIPLSEELDFIGSYIYLIRTRFDDNIQFTLNLKPGHVTWMLPPLTLQMLIENAIKHNLIHENSPLAIQLLQLDDDYLIVSNTLNEKKEISDRKGSGLDNIKNRYLHFTDKPVKIIKTKTHFEVHIPLLEIEHV